MSAPENRPRWGFVLALTLYGVAFAAIGAVAGYVNCRQRAAAEREALGTFERLGHDVVRTVLEPLPAKPECNSLCQAMTASVLLHRSEGPLPHDCQFFAACGCDYQCPKAQP